MGTTELATFASLAGQYGFPLVLSALLLWYVFSNQKRLDIKSDAREASYQKCIADMKDKILVTACDSNGVIKGVSADVDKLDQKVNQIDGKVSEIDRKTDKIMDKMDMIHQKL